MEHKEEEDVAEEVVDNEHLSFSTMSIRRDYTLSTTSRWFSVAEDPSSHRRYHDAPMMSCAG